MTLQKSNIDIISTMFPGCCLHEGWSILFTEESRSPEQLRRLSRETQSSSGTVHTFRWQSADDYSKDNAPHVSNNWQIIYVIFSTVISVEGTNCVANIKPPAEERRKKEMCYKRLMEGERKREREEWIGGGEYVPGSAFSWLKMHSHLWGDKHTYGHHLSNILRDVKAFHSPCQPVWQMMYVFLQSRDY